MLVTIIAVRDFAFIYVCRNIIKMTHSHVYHAHWILLLIPSHLAVFDSK